MSPISQVRISGAHSIGWPRMSKHRTRVRTVLRVQPASSGTQTCGFTGPIFGGFTPGYRRGPCCRRISSGNGSSPAARPHYLSIHSATFLPRPPWLLRERSLVIGFVHMDPWGWKKYVRVISCKRVSYMYVPSRWKIKNNL